MSSSNLTWMLGSHLICQPTWRGGLERGRASSNAVAHGLDGPRAFPLPAKRPRADVFDPPRCAGVGVGVGQSSVGRISGVATAQDIERGRGSAVLGAEGGDGVGIVGGE